LPEHVSVVNSWNNVGKWVGQGISPNPGSQQGWVPITLPNGTKEKPPPKRTDPDDNIPPPAEHGSITRPKVDLMHADNMFKLELAAVIVSSLVVAGALVWFSAGTLAPAVGEAVMVEMEVITGATELELSTVSFTELEASRLMANAGIGVGYSVLL
jgi:hypothetical protein